MDRPVRPRRYRRSAIAAGIAAAVAVLAALLWQLAPRGLQVPLAEVRIATVERGLFRDDVALRATAAPLHSVMLDAVESGRVEEVFARDGALVQRGEVLFRLSNPQRRLELLAREAEHAQQISNMTNLRVALEASRTARQRRGSDLAFALMQAEKQHARNVALAQKGFVSATVLEETADRLAQQRDSLDTEKASDAIESATQRDAIRQMEQAIARLEAGMQLVNATVEALAVRAPVAGRLTDFRLLVGQTVPPGQRLGRIDDVAQFKLSAQVDEFYLNRVTPGRRGMATIGGQAHPVSVSRIYPQISDGKFAVELAFDNRQPKSLSPGQGVEASITLGGSSEALLLPNDAFVNDSGGMWVFVVSHDGAERRDVRTGRRNNSQVEVLSGLAPGERVVVSSYAKYGQASRLQFSK
ncbi:efflux RND transporter periplasmic adaptor subunit [Massilia cavernae]|uniref:Efflux RND transporter periplasmic adaptor subunit n=1 Tax=Massilia cavernae TaxID=2320864 RepID=A0A418X7F1_9BURK|nr:efflux RND transporter periplasmic adaptor subunit [Massilia cavernae]RJG08380.1 efflux RND transporter periplasmic adaptor subunit [Massilia cavernae]